MNDINNINKAKEQKNGSPVTSSPTTLNKGLFRFPIVLLFAVCAFSPFPLHATNVNREDRSRYVYVFDAVPKATDQSLTSNSTSKRDSASSTISIPDKSTTDLKENYPHFLLSNMRAKEDTMRSIEAKPALSDAGKPTPVDLQLLMAVNNNDLEGIMIKLDEGANIEAFDVQGYNALQNALSNDNNSICVCTWLQ